MIGTTMQAQLPKILQLLLDKDEKVRSAAIATAHKIVAHRLVIPIEVHYSFISYSLLILCAVCAIHDGFGRRPISIDI